MGVRLDVVESGIAQVLARVDVKQLVGTVLVDVDGVLSCS